MTQEEFLARAWQAANEKAHELGWIIDPGRRMIRDYCHSLGVGKVEMRRVGIAGIAEQPEHLTCCHLVAPADTQAARLHVRIVGDPISL